MKKILIMFAILFALPITVNAAEGEVQILMLNDANEVTSSFYPFGEDYRGSGSINAGDLGGDGTDEILVGSGPGLLPNVKIFRQDGSLISEFLAYNENYRNGLTVTTCDLDGDNSQEIITGTMFGGGPHVRIFESDGTVLYNGGFFAYDGKFRGGVNVACGDIDGDGLDDIVTGAGLTGGPHIKVFSPNGNMKYEIFAGSAFESSGTTVAVGDVDGDNDVEIITGRMGEGDSTITIFDLRKNQLSFMLALNSFKNYEGGISVTSADLDGDKKNEIGVSTNKHETGMIKFFELSGEEHETIKPFSETSKGVLATPIKNNGKETLIAISTTPKNSKYIGKYIEIDLSDQKLSAFENGILVNSFLVSTGTYQYPTPIGKTEITDKLLWHDYSWYFGEGDARNYSLPNVKFNLRFRPSYFIHSAYWHNNFGHRMSHGCINVNLENAEWIFNWAPIGTTVEVVN